MKDSTKKTRKSDGLDRKSEKADPVTTLIHDVVTELRAQLDVVSARREQLPPGSFDPEVSKAASNLGRSLTACASELRQRERQAAKAQDSLTEAIVTAWLRALPEHQRLRFARLLQESMDDDASVL